MKQTKRLLALLLVMAMVMVNVPAPVFAVGTTNADGYIEVRTIEDLYNIRNDLTANYILMNDIDLTSATAVGGDWDYGGRGWNPIGSGDIYGNNAFSGIFDGNGYKIIGLQMSISSLPSGASSPYVGLFGYVSGTVKNLDMIDVQIALKTCPSDRSSYVGAIAGYVNGGSIENCHVLGSVSGRAVGGSKSSFDVANYTGGIVGRAINGTIDRCSMGGSVEASISMYFDPAYAGGISGYGGTITNCYNIATVAAKNRDDINNGSGYYAAYSSGIANNATITDCYNAGDVVAYEWSYATAYSAGIGTGSANVVSNSYNVGKITTSNDDTISSGYAIGNSTNKYCYYLSGSGSNTTGATSLTKGQMLAQSMYAGFDFDDVWEMDTTAVYPYPQLRSNIQDMRIINNVDVHSEPNQTAYRYGENLNLTGATIQVEYVDGSVEIVAVTETMVSGYDAKKPGLQTVTVIYMGWTTVFTVTVNEKVYIPIYTIEDLYNIRDDLTANYILMNDIDLTAATAEGGDWNFNGNGWNPIGSNDVYGNGTFSGEFDGNGHKIIGMRIDVADRPAGMGHVVHLGLFANITGDVSDLEMTNVSIKMPVFEDTLYCGAVAGKMTGTMTNVSVNGGSIDVDTEEYGGNTAYVGGVVGYYYGDALRISNTASISATVYGDYYTGANAYTGGIFGYLTGLNGSIKESFNTGRVYGYGNQYTYDCAAGIAGYGNNAQIVNCYNTGDVTGLDYGAGIANKGAIKKSYSIGESNKYALQSNGGTTTEGYFLDGSGTSSTGATALTESQMKIQSMYKGFDFENTWILNEFANYPYPQLRNNIQDLSESASLVSIIALPNKTEYMTGDQLDFTGAMVKVVYVSGKEEIIEITDDIVSGFNMNTVGEQKVKVTVAGASDTYTINVIERPVVESITITSQPNTKIFAVGTAFDFTGAKALVSYVGGITETVDITPDMTTGGNIDHIGKQTITYAFGGKSATFVVEVVGVALEKIVLTKLPDKLNYLEGQDLDLTGMVVTAVMNNGIENTIGTGYTISGYSSEPGTYTITVAYLGKTATFEITVAERKLVSLALNALPDKLEYVSGQEFDESGMQVIATYDNGDVIVAEQYTVSGFNSVPGIKNVVVSLDGQSVSFTVKVIARVITDFKLVTLPSKLDYIEYDSLDISGLKVEATYNDGVTETVTDYALTGFSSKPGTHTINVAYEGFVKSFEINVIPRVLEDIKVIAPNKVTYYIGEAFDATGIEVIACYNNGQEIAVDDYTVSGFESAAPGAKTISITYGGITRSFAIAVQERSVIEANGSFVVDNLVGRLGEEVRLPVTVTSNTGIAGLRHEISFEASNLKIVGVEMKGDYANGTLIVNEEKAADGKITIVWFSNDDVENKGIVYELVFQIQETAVDGITEVKLDFNDNDHGNISGENVIFGDQDGSVEVRSYWLGDLNGDRKYAMVDLVMLAQYVAGFDMTLAAKQELSADVNEDGTIDIHDVILLNQWLLAEDF